ncbi:NAD(P)/FAD-dependent oxidoreductase [Anaerosalibacter massiliensis]|uniref:NAD(P)/FAD-dependent oxidoreductase n=1 Tax=Anaerosalibacter massiliensis TaxID=1347392 RepID=A0A9X2S5K3_9FIRM|nr:NAD(P)/FAD-dependent oxidoreductase [Anaerosalibacter massiliensis]MCR2044414.1 NAD(P)/FAD-dependent oxidoreductase [Anaerosalibacter massiliensis]
MEYKNLFEKGSIGKVNLKNRIVMPAMGTSLATSTGEASDEIIRYYEERAEGGCGLIITEITRIDNETGVGLPNQLCAIEAKHIPRLEKLARAVHRHGTKIFLQLHHPGRQSYSRLIEGRQIVAPSPITCKTVGEKPREMTTEEVEGLVKKFVIGAKIAQTAGIDGIELHGAHGYLIGQFLSPLTNRRTDKYGGSFNNRMRFVTEIILGIRHICGPNFPISVRIDGDEFVEGGITHEEAIKMARYLESIGIDAINVSSGTYESGITIIEPISYKEGWKKHLAQGIKDNVKIPVIACDAIKTPEFAEKLLEEGNCDFIALGRAQLADSKWAKKAKEGREKEIRPCIACLHCIEQLMNGKTVECAVNPRLGYENEYSDYRKNGEGRTIVVIGGGPAGMEAARVLAEREFKVVLFEKKNNLGGSVYLGSKPPCKERLQNLIDNMEYQMRQLGVDIRLGSSPTIEEIKALNPYSVFIAIGGKNIVPELPGIHGENVVLATNVLDKEMDVKNKKIVVVGSGMTGLETAEYLAEKGNKVKVVEMLNEIGPGVYRSVLYDITTRLEKYGVKMIPCRKLVGIDNGKVNVLNTNNNEKIAIETDYVVLSLGVTSVENNEFVKDIQNNFNNVMILGDATKPGKISNATQTGFDLAYTLE